MEVLTSAVVLAWLVLVLLAFAMLGILRQLRDLQQTVIQRNNAGPTAPRRELPAELRPQAGREYSAILLVDAGCPTCERVAPVFAELARTSSGDIDFVLLSYSDEQKWDALEGVRRVMDQAAYHRLDPGWRPAVVVLDAAGEVLATEPAGSEESVRAVVESVVGARLPTAR